MKHQSTLIRSLAVGMAALLMSGLASAQSAQNYPSRPVRLVIPFVAGGSTDIIGRSMATLLSDMWGQSVLVDNRGGGATVIATDIVAKATPDGHTLQVATASFSTNPTLFAGKLPYDSVKDFSLIMLINTSPLVLVVPANSQAKAVKDLIAMAKSRGGQMNYGSSAVGGAGHLSAELFNMMAEIKVQHVPYKGNAPALLDLVAGRVDFVFNGTTSVLNLIQTGKLRGLGVTGLKRVGALPDVPTLDEAGLKGYSSVAWNGLAAPAKTPTAIINKINADANKALANKEFQQRLIADGSESGGGTVQQFVTFVREETAKWAKVIKAGNIQPE